MHSNTVCVTRLLIFGHYEIIQSSVKVIKGMTELKKENDNIVTNK